MGVSPRHTRRILADYRKNGAASLAHGHRGRKPANAIPEATRSRVVHLARTVYEGANHTHLSELLSERVGLDMGRTTLRRILVNAGLSSPRRRRPPKHRVRRQRMPRQGMLIQMDGSYRLKDAIDQTPFILRSSREFDAAGEYARLVGEMVQRRNRLVQFNLPTMGTQSVSRFTTTAHASTGCARSPGSPRARTGRPTSSRGQALRARPDAPDPPTEAGPLGPRRFRGPWRHL